MDVNRTRFHLLAGPDGFPAQGGDLAWHAQGCLALAPEQGPKWPRAAFDEDPGPAWVRDRYGQHARIAAKSDETAESPDVAIVESRTIVHDAGGSWEALTLVDGAKVLALRPPGAAVFTDLALGGPPGEERLAALWREGSKHGVLILHLRTRWHDSVELAASAQRLLVDAKARVWVAGDDRLLRIEGEPLPLPYRPQAARFEPERITPNPPHVAWTAPADGGLKDGVRAMASDGSLLYVLCGSAEKPVVATRPLDPTDANPPVWTRYAIPADDLPTPLSDIAVLAPGRVALLADFDPSGEEPEDPKWRRRDCPVFDLRKRIDDEGEVVLDVTSAPERHPFVELPAPRFVAGPDDVVRWRGARGVVRALSGLAIARFANEGAWQVVAPLDSALPGCVWHKIVLEARIPATTKLRIDARAAETDALEDLTDEDWEEQPPPTWSPLTSELPWAENSVTQRRGEAGCFEVLLQRRAGNVRRIVGRHLQLRLRFSGDGRSTPALRRLRAYFPRFSYQEHYLPPHFRQQEARSEAGPANGADFRERLLAVFEGLLTPIEDRVAAAELLADPHSCPERLLPRLASLLGFQLDPSLPLGVRRRLVAGIGDVARWRGTLRGVQAALDLVTGDGVREGRIVVIENHRLRRTFATLLGVNIDDADNPLTLGTMHSGNSIVGDSLILSPESARALLAAIDPSLGPGVADRAAAEAFFERWAHQVTVLLHGEAKQLRAVVQRVLTREMPAHVKWQVVESDHAFVLGLSPLLSVDTSLEREPPPVPVVLDTTRLSREGLLTDAAAISPHHVRSGDRT